MAGKTRNLLPDYLVGWKPFGVGEQRPNDYLEIWKAAVENRGDAPRAIRIMREGVCDGCALGTSGLKDWTIPGIHLCNIRLRLLRMNTMPAFDPAVTTNVAALDAMRGDHLRELGRIPEPMMRRRGEPGFTPLSWTDAMELMASRVRASDPSRCAYFMTSRGIPNETYYSVQKGVRAMGGNSIDNAARLCHSPSTVALKQTIGAGASTCSYKDWIAADAHRVRRLQRGEQPAGRHEISALREEARREGDQHQHLSRAGDGAILGAVDPLERGVRHANHRPFPHHQPGRRYRLPQWRHASHARERMAGQAVCRRPHHRLRRARGITSRAAVGAPRAGFRRHARRDGGVRALDAPVEAHGDRLEHGRHAARHR